VSSHWRLVASLAFLALMLCWSFWWLGFVHGDFGRWLSVGGASRMPFVGSSQAGRWSLSSCCVFVLF
jgi:hypothetical protein